MPITPEHEQIIVSINDRVNEILLNGGDHEALLVSLAGNMDDVWKIIKAAKEDELNLYCQQYSGFYCFMRLLEELAVGLSTGKISV